jgi:hypothetical protein
VVLFPRPLLFFPYLSSPPFSNHSSLHLLSFSPTLILLLLNTLGTFCDSLFYIVCVTSFIENPKIIIAYLYTECILSFLFIFLFLTILLLLLTVDHKICPLTPLFILQLTPISKCLDCLIFHLHCLDVPQYHP